MSRSTPRHLSSTGPIATIAVESPNGSSGLPARSTNPAELNCPAMRAVGRQIRDNPHASKMARKALELPTLRMQLSEHFRLRQLSELVTNPSCPSALDHVRLIKKPCSIQNRGLCECAVELIQRQRDDGTSELAPPNSHLVGRLQSKPSIK